MVGLGFSKAIMWVRFPLPVLEGEARRERDRKDDRLGLSVRQVRAGNAGVPGRRRVLGLLLVWLHYREREDVPQPEDGSVQRQSQAPGLQPADEEVRVSSFPVRLVKRRIGELFVSPLSSNRSILWVVLAFALVVIVAANDGQWFAATSGLLCILVLVVVWRENREPLDSSGVN